MSSSCWLSVHVLYTYSSEDLFIEHYEKVKQQFPWVNFVFENGTEQQITNILEARPALDDIPAKSELRPFFSFMVDDMIFFREIDIQLCLLTLEISHTSYALHLKLSPNICFSHTSNKLITLPKFEPAETVSP